MSKINIGDKVRVTQNTQGDVLGRVAEWRMGNVGVVINDYSAHPEEVCPYGVEFPEADPAGGFAMAFAADELERA